MPFLKFVLAAASHNLGATFPQDFELFLGEHEPYLMMVVSVGKLTVRRFPPARVRGNVGLIVINRYGGNGLAFRWTVDGASFHPSHDDQF